MILTLSLPRHGPITACTIAHSEKLVLEYLAAEEGSAERQTIEKRFGRSNVQKLVLTYEEEKANNEWLHSSTMECPGCQCHVEKSLGCNHVSEWVFISMLVGLTSLTNGR